MKVTINVNGAPTEITLTPEQLAQIEAQKKHHFKWKYEQSKTFHLGTTSVVKFEAMDCETTLPIEHGRYRKTKEVAERSLLRNKRANRLEALAEQLNGLENFKYLKPNYYILASGGKWNIDYHKFSFSPERVYMTRDCALEICRMLNEGEFSLDGEL